MTDPAQVAAWPWHEYAVVLNAAAYTAVDLAETPDGRAAAWAANAAAPATLARIAAEHRITLVHYSTDYVFDGTAEQHTEDEPLCAAGRLRPDQGSRRHRRRHGAAPLPAPHLVGDRRRQELRADDAEARRRRASRPTVVADQVGRLTFTDELSRATRHLLSTRRAVRRLQRQQRRADHLVGRPGQGVFRLSGRDEADVTPITTEQYVAGKEGIAPRPANSTLDLSKLEATGFRPADAIERLAAYCVRP